MMATTTLLDVLQVARRRCIFSWKPFSTYCGAARVQPLVDYELMRSIDGPYPGGRRLPFPLRLMPQSNRWNGSIKRKASKMDLYVWKKKTNQSTRFGFGSPIFTSSFLDSKFDSINKSLRTAEKKKKKKKKNRRQKGSGFPFYSVLIGASSPFFYGSIFHRLIRSQDNKTTKNYDATQKLLGGP